MTRSKEPVTHALVSAILLLFTQQLFAQVNFFVPISRDSVKIYFNSRGHFIDKPCAEYIRYTRISTGGVYNSYFEDVGRQGEIFGKGYYRNGKRHGAFETYYPNGQLREKRFYENNVPVGEWEFFYENGKPERTLGFTRTDTLLLQFGTEEGKQKIVNGAGEVHGLVAGHSGYPASIVARGKVLNGKPDGKWTSTYKGLTYCKEDYEEGRFVRGTFPNAQTNRVYRFRPHLNTFVIPDYLRRLEERIAENCADSSKYARKADEIKLDLSRFGSELKTRVDRVLEEEARNRQEWAETLPGDNNLTIEFSVDEKGKAKDFRQITPWGTDYYREITNTIRSFATFPANLSAVYFHFRLSRTSNAMYHYNYSFSRQRISNL